MSPYHPLRTFACGGMLVAAGEARGPARGAELSRSLNSPAVQKLSATQHLGAKQDLNGNGSHCMSVAFRRDSDEEHREPRFELPIPPGPNLVTERGYDLIKSRTEDLEAALAGAVSDEYRAELQRDLRYWRTRLATAQVAPVPT